nr:ABC transporter permease [uncultured Holophaga sp.]
MFRVALKMLFGDRGKYLGIVTGIALATLLMIQQPGMLISILKEVNSVLNDVSGPDLWVMDPAVKNFDDSKAMMDTQMYRVRGVPGVAWAIPFYRGAQKVRMANGESVQSQIVGLDDATLIAGPPKILKGKLEDLRRPDAVIVDKAGAEGRLARTDPATGKPIPLKIGDSVEINEKRAVIVGIAQATQGFQSQPIIYTTYTRAKTYALSERKLMTYVLAKAKTGENPDAVARRITQQTGLKAYTTEEFKAKNLEYMVKNTGIIMNFGFVVLIGFVVGAAVTGQIFYNFTLDNLRHFGVFKAMGTPNATLRRMILLQAVVVGLIGFGIGAGISAFFILLQSGGNGLQTTLNFPLLLGSGTAVLVIVLMASLISIRKVMKLEPAIVFKG